MSAVRSLPDLMPPAFAEGLAATVAWYRDHRDWWEPLKRKAGL